MLKKCTDASGQGALSKGTFDYERKVLQKIQHISHVTKLLDLFEKDDTTYMLIREETALTIIAVLREFLTNTANQNVSLLDFAGSTVAQTCKVLSKLHHAGIVHRQLSTRSIRVNYSSSNKRFKVKAIDSFDLSIALT